MAVSRLIAEHTAALLLLLLGSRLSVLGSDLGFRHACWATLAFPLEQGCSMAPEDTVSKVAIQGAFCCACSPVSRLMHVLI